MITYRICLSSFHYFHRFSRNYRNVSCICDVILHFCSILCGFANYCICCPQQMLKFFIFDISLELVWNHHRHLVGPLINFTGQIICIITSASIDSLVHLFLYSVRVDQYCHECVFWFLLHPYLHVCVFAVKEYELWNYLVKNNSTDQNRKFL